MSEQLFSQTFNAHVDPLYDNPAHCVPDFSYEYSDAYGTSRLMVENVRLTNTSAFPVFNISYEHMSPGSGQYQTHDLLDYMPVGSYFTDSPNIWKTQLTPRGANIDIYTVDLNERAGLLLLAHEIGHTHQLPLVEDLYAYAIHGQKVPERSEKLFAAYIPSVDSLASYVNSNPSFIDDMSNASQIVSERSHDIGLDTTDLTALSSIEVVASLEHIPASIAVSALLEADAWLNAIRLLDDGVLHPGMDIVALHDSAIRASAQYDAARNTTLFTDTLQHAIQLA